ncbi:hypothetical protein XHC_3182 [Xanthomonas hortorum pv. carotae str. M081]|nr:hypothetical protein XHC_3182 [Xanthomonas hortorum pv. carotae str. M081]
MRRWSIVGRDATHACMRRVVHADACKAIEERNKFAHLC